MVVQRNFLLKLRDFGINTYESRLWTALLSRGSSNAGELSDIANVPRSRTYDVLESLERKGFILRKGGKPITYLAVPPHEVVDRVKQKVLEEANEASKLLEELQDSPVLSELSDLHSKGAELVEPSDLTASVAGRENLQFHLASRLAKAKTSVSMLTTAQGLQRKAFLLPLMKDLKKKGVSITIAAPLSSENKALADAFSKVAEVKHTSLAGRMCIIDRQEVTLMLQHDDVHPSYDMAVWTHSPSLASALQSLLDQRK